MWGAIKQYLGVAPATPAPATPPAVELFRQGYSVPQIAATLGYGGPTMTQGHRQIEAELRAYIGSLEQLVDALAAERARA